MYIYTENDIRQMSIKLPREKNKKQDVFVFVSHLSGLVVGEVVVTQPDPERRSLKLCSYQSVKLQSRTETGSLLTLKLHLDRQTHRHRQDELHLITEELLLTSLFLFLCKLREILPLSRVHDKQK